MKFRISKFFLIGLVIILNMVACQAEDARPTVDVASTLAVQLASTMIAQTAAAYSPTPLPSSTPLPATETSFPTEISTSEPTGNQPLIVNVVGEPDPPCTFGPGSSYEIESYIHTPKEVELLGVGNVPGWYVIKNPYFGAPCWLPTERIEIDAAINLSTLPVIAP